MSKENKNISDYVIRVHFQSPHGESCCEVRLTEPVWNALSSMGKDVWRALQTLLPLMAVGAFWVSSNLPHKPASIPPSPPMFERVE